MSTALWVCIPKISPFFPPKIAELVPSSVEFVDSMMAELAAQGVIVLVAVLAAMTFPSIWAIPSLTYILTSAAGSSLSPVGENTTSLIVWTA